MQISAVKGIFQFRSLLWFIVFALASGLMSCSKDQFIMYTLYTRYHTQITTVTRQSVFPESFLAALISLESDPTGNRNSSRFEPGVYERLIALKYSGKRFGGIKRSSIKNADDSLLVQYATSYGLTQIMGYHCIRLGCKTADLTGPDQLGWAVRYMELHYGNHARRKDWASCFRVHNTGHPRGETARKDYVEKGLLRMKIYDDLSRNDGSLF